MMEMQSAFQELKGRMHYKVIDQVDLGRLSKLDDEAANRELETAIKTVLEKENISLPQKEREQLVLEIRHEVLGLGPLEPLLADQGWHPL
jgi:pilus assembly protein CpaF